MSMCASQIVRRSPWTCLSCSTVTKTSQALINGSTILPSPARIHQRKNSSSKASSPPKNEPRAITAPTEAPTQTAKEAKLAVKNNVEKSPTTRASKRRVKDATQDAAVQASNGMAVNVPSVPSTSHVHPAGMASQDATSLQAPI